MDVKLRYTGGEDYDVSEDFLESISEIDFTTAIKIARNIGNGWVTLPQHNYGVTRSRWCCRTRWRIYYIRIRVIEIRG